MRGRRGDADSVLSHWFQGSSQGNPTDRMTRRGRRASRNYQTARRTAALGLLAILAVGSGCAQTAWVRMREVPANPLAGPLKLLSHSGPQPTERTMLLLRRYNLEDEVKHPSDNLLAKLHEINKQEPSPDKLYSISELAYLAGKRAEPINRRRAIEMHGLAVVNAYHYLFDARFGRYRNPYDPEFRGACNLYNSALESTLRIIKKQGELVPGATRTIHTANQSVEATIVLRSNTWRAEDFEDFRFVSDYELKGLQNQYHNYGLGVPLIAVRKHRKSTTTEDKFYPPGLSFPVTAFMRVLEGHNQPSGQHVVHIELHDPLNTSEINVDGRSVPLESDLTTPLAYALNQKQLRNLDSSTAGLLNPAKTEKLQGLYMLEPYQPGKIPVLMIHGLWSSPITWMEMFNDLRGAPEIRSRYQFWFYLYPSGQPFWHSAVELRRDLAEARRIIDPQYRQEWLDKMVLVGHSMGGLVAELQTLDSRNDFWKIVSDEPFQFVKAEPDAKQDLADTFFFRPNPSVRRVITIGTPFRGSNMSNSTTRWLGSKLITLPQMLIAHQQQLRKDNPNLFRESANLIDVATSIDSLSPESPILPVMLNSQRPPWVKYHNIVGRIPDPSFVGRIVGPSDGDGVVTFTSAHLDNVQSEIVVNAEHSEIHRHPLSVLEVHRILLEHVAQCDAKPPSRLERLPYTASTAGAPSASGRAADVSPASGTAVAPSGLVADPWTAEREQTPPLPTADGFVSP
jgi:pimeloyl-ACP methyl ester carboxylesterase